MESEAQKACPLTRRTITFSDMWLKHLGALSARKVEDVYWDISDSNVWGGVEYPTAGGIS